MANDTIGKVASSSDVFAKSIMSKVEECVLSGHYSADTCTNLINVISNVSADATTAFTFLATVEKLL